jgi:predicted DNA-binding transcriptional regulator AlpA
MMKHVEPQGVSKKNTEEKGDGMKKLLTLAETAARTNLSEKSIRMRIFRGAFPVTRIGKRIFITESELEKFIQQQTVTAEEALEKMSGAR